jgi:putative transposase
MRKSFVYRLYPKSVHSHLLQTVVQDLDKAFEAFFRRVKAGEKPGYPRFRGRNRWRSFGFKIDGRRLKLSGIGRVAVRWHRPIEGEIKTLRISKKAGRWYASFSCVVKAQPLPQTGQEIGLDVGLKRLITTSEGETVDHPSFYRAGQKKLRVCQRRVARRKKGGKNRRKAIVMLQRQHCVSGEARNRWVANQRKDYLHKLAHDLVQRYDRIALEDLRITNMVRNPHLAKSILDAGWGYFAAPLTYKAESAGRVVVAVHPRYTSKTCSQCGHLFESLTLKDRWVTCACGLSLDRDHNAAINIRDRAGQARWALSSPIGGLAQEAAPL